MKTIINTLLLTIFIVYLNHPVASAQAGTDLYAAVSFNVGQHIGKLRSVVVKLGPEKEGLLMIYSADKEIDPWEEMFYPPTDRVKMAMYTRDGNLLWKKELGPGVINGIWFMPVYPFDLDGDGTDEIYFVNNIDSVHVLSYHSRRLEALNSRTGETTGQWPWKKYFDGTLSHTYRFFILGGYAGDEPVLVTAHGTYGRMGLQAWSRNMEKRWELVVEEDEAGARGSHMCPVVDINDDGTDELLWGERCINIDNGKYLFVADRDRYNGHSDVIQPTLNRVNNRWYIFTCRESGDKGEIKPRVAMFDDKGQRVWTALK
ncbi:MAG TPA: hypothetical protein VE870_11485, partial [Bacteroidales bacterium]|nr:hypothetical protein [Bacteroidales bacterium]